VTICRKVCVFVLYLGTHFWIIDSECGGDHFQMLITPYSLSAHKI